jgi:hypothetical protein
MRLEATATATTTERGHQQKSQTEKKKMWKNCATTGRTIELNMGQGKKDKDLHVRPQAVTFENSQKRKEKKKNCDVLCGHRPLHLKDEKSSAE